MPAKHSVTIEIDGSYGEGSGALLRTAVIMSALTSQGLRLKDVRAATAYPGLDFEDVQLIQLAGQLCSADLTGVELRSDAFEFLPQAKLHPVDFPSPTRQTGRGANALVVLGSLIPLLARTGGYTEISLIGQTVGQRTLMFDYFANVTLPAFHKMGIYAKCDHITAGYSREAYGQITAEIEPSVVEGLNWIDRGRLVQCRAIVSTSDLPIGIVDRAISHLKRLSGYANVPIRISSQEVAGSSPGISVTAWAEFENGMGGVSSTGTRGVRVETVVQDVFDQLNSFLASDATVDIHLADQLLLPAVLSEETTSFKVSRLTRRLLTMIWVIKQFTPIHITARGMEGEPGTVTIEK